MEMRELTLEKFEEASEIVGKVTQETKLIYSEYFRRNMEIKFISSRKICSGPAPTRYGAPTIRSSVFPQRSGRRD